MTQIILYLIINIITTPN